MTGGQQTVAKHTGFTKEAYLHYVVLEYIESTGLEIDVKQHTFILGRTRSTDECLQMHKTVITSMS